MDEAEIEAKTAPKYNKFDGLFHQDGKTFDLQGKEVVPQMDLIQSDKQDWCDSGIKGTDWCA